MQRFEQVSPDALRQALAGPHPPALVDVREPAAYRLGRIPGSANAPVHRLGELRSRLPASLATRIVVIADDRDHARAAARFLTLVGFGDVAVLDGGIAAFPGPFEDGEPRGAVDRAEPPGPQLRILPAERTTRAGEAEVPGSDEPGP